MQLYPTIELQNGKPVSLYRGRLEEPQIWHVDPVETVRGFAQAGAEWIHVTDFDAIEGKPPQDDLLRALVLAAEVPGTVALTSPDFVKEVAKYHPDQVVLAVDVFEGRVMSNGWRETSAYEPADFISWFAEDPLAALLVTDIDSDLGDAEASLSLVTDLAERARHPVIASGLVRTLDDLSRLKYVRNVSGAVVGRALFDKSVDLEAALALAAQPLEETAEFM